MADEVAEQKLTRKQVQAALLVAEDEQTDAEIASEVGISRTTLWEWRKRPVFAAVVDENLAIFRQRILSTGFADKTKRIKALNSLATAVLVELSREADDTQPQGMYRLEKKISANGEIVEQEVFDKPKHDTFRGYLDDIAKEQGERKTVAEVTGKDGEPLVLGIVGVDIGKV